MPSFRSLAAACGVLLASSVGNANGNPVEARTPSPYPGWAGLKYMFSFGDSYTQTGFNMTNGSPMPTSGNPLGNPGFPGWTSSNGPNWIGYLTQEFNASELMMYNLAYGGATIDSALVTPWRPDVLSLKNQIEDLFVPILGPKPAFAPWKGTNSLFSFFIGINDIGNSYWNGNFDTFHNILLDEYFGLVEKLYALGARNFVFISVPPIDRSPLTVGQGSQAVTLQNSALISFNTKLSQRVIALQKAKSSPHPGRVWTKLFDSTRLYNSIIERPEKYGLKNVTEFCESYQYGTPSWTTYYPECGVPVDEYLWFNNLHPGFKLNKAMAAEFVKLVR